MQEIKYKDLKPVQEDENWIRYEFLKEDSITIFQKTPTNRMTLSAHKSKPIESLINKLNEYVNWLNDCRNTLEDFYRNEFADLIEEYNFDLSDWYETLEVYGLVITITENGVFCADISCGDCVFEDHILDISFFGYEIESMNLDG